MKTKPEAASAAIAFDDLIDDSEMALPAAPVPGRRATAGSAGPPGAEPDFMPLLLAPATPFDSR